MISLFLNTSGNIQIGLLDSKSCWIDYIETQKSKASEILHSMIFEMLNKHRFTAKDIDTVYTIAGPGSYTGLRLGEGLAQVLSMNDVKHYSFYLTDVFEILDLKDYLFYTNAFKKEYFIYENGESFLTKNFDLIESSSRKLYSIDASGKIENMKNLIYKNSSLIFDYIQTKKIKKEVFYYRSLEAEFGR